MKVYRDVTQGGLIVKTEIYDIAQATYSGKDMGERKIEATIQNPTVIDFKVGDYLEIDMANLQQGHGIEKFYIQTLPTVKKVASSGSVQDAFEHIVSFFPAQYELGTVQMRDLVQEVSAANLIYTGYGDFTFYGGAHRMMRRIMYVLNERFGTTIGTGYVDGNPTAQQLAQNTGWNYYIAEAVDEDENHSLEDYQFTFSGNTVWDALVMLTNEDGVNTNFFINGRTIYIGFAPPHVMQVSENNVISTTDIFQFRYGKTSHLKGVPNSNYVLSGGLFDITKSIGDSSPITRLYAYGASKNLNRFYCADRVTSGRYINRLMLPSFARDGRTDYIDSLEGIQKFGIREGAKNFEEIYPSLRNVTYATIRNIKYCITLRDSAQTFADGTGRIANPLACIQCYQVKEGQNGVNYLKEEWPAVPICVFVHATGKTIKTILWTSLAEQQANDFGHTPMALSEGSCYCVHNLQLTGDNNPGLGYSEGKDIEDYECSSRADWFTNIDNPLQQYTDAQMEEIKLHQIEYTDDYWGNEVFVCELENSIPLFDEQTVYLHDNYSFGCWPRINIGYNKGINSDNMLVNEIVAVQPITEIDTDINIQNNLKPYFYIYLRDIGFRINQQAYSGQYNWLLGDVTISFLDGYLGGLEFNINGDNSNEQNIVSYYLDDGSVNPNWLADAGVDSTVASAAVNNGAIWRIRCNRKEQDSGAILPNKILNAQAGDHIVFLGIQMPDIYIYAAQDRLQKEALKYLNDNDNGDISYAINFDKIRLVQQSMLGMQLREGVKMRIIDDDLKIYTDNEERYLADYVSNPTLHINDLSVEPIGYNIIKQYFTLSANKHYEIELDVVKNLEQASSDNYFGLFESKDDVLPTFIPSFTIEETETKRLGYVHYKIEFNTDSSFNTNIDYLFGVLEEQYGTITKSQIYLYSVKESNTTESGEQAHFVDLTLDQITIELSDNDRSYTPGGTTPSTGIGIQKTITAVVKETQQASVWQSTVNRIVKNTNQGNALEKSTGELANDARKKYNELKDLRESIFDPDGSVNSVFFRTMMLQVGADSMNYSLEKTRIVNGSLSNITLTKNSSTNKWTINFGNDTLHHYTYTDYNNGGQWSIANASIGNLNNTVYYIALKCATNSELGQWIVTSDQKTVDAYAGYKVFNYGMIAACALGATTRFITETRGNVFVYGDNVVLGRIASITGDSYLDLLLNKFKLGNQLTFQNGQLAIAGGAIIGGGNKTASQLIEEIHNVGGDNLYSGSNPLTVTDVEAAIFTAHVKEGDFYVVSVLYNDPNGHEIHFICEDAEPADIEIQQDDARQSAVFRFEYEADIEIRVVSPNDSILNDIMIQKGVVATDYHRYNGHVLDAFEQTAIQGQTEIQGGLILSSLIELTDPDTQQVLAGLSGLNMFDGNIDNILMWGGGSYASARQGQTPVMITKSGIGSVIGCFNVVDANTISIVSDGNIIYLSNNSIESYINNFSTVHFNSDGLFSVTNIPTPQIIKNSTPLVSINNIPKGSYRIDLPDLTITYSGGLNPNPGPLSGMKLTVYSVALQVRSGNTILSTTLLNNITKTIQTPSQTEEEVSIAHRSINFYNSSVRNITIDLVFRCECRIIEDAWATISYTETDGSDQSSVVGIDKITVIGNNGIHIRNNSSSYFTIFNSGSGIDVRMTGLPTAPAATSTPGRLYTQVMNSKKVICVE